jgi:predicted nucleotidyltransferase
MVSKSEHFGLRANEVIQIKLILEKNKKVVKALIYGSRAMGNYRPGSDIDLTLIGNQLDLSDLNKIYNDIDDLNLPYSLDLSIFHLISNIDLIDRIQRRAKIFYQQ